MVHITKNNPRPDVRVMVVSVMSSNPEPVKALVFQAAVPKVRVALDQSESIIQSIMNRGPVHTPVIHKCYIFGIF